MLTSDPFPRRLLLGPRECMELLSMDKTTWYEFLLDTTTGFPPAVAVGKTRNGKPRLRWQKVAVLAWLTLLKPPTEES